MSGIDEPVEHYISRAGAVALVGAIAYHFPVFRPLLQEHLVDQEGEILPDIFMGELETWVEDEFVNRYVQSRELIGGLLTFLENAMGDQDGDVSEVIYVSFLEDFPRPGQLGSEIRGIVGPKMTEALHQIG